MDVVQYVNGNGSIFWGGNLFYQGMEFEYDETVNGGAYRHAFIGRTDEAKAGALVLDSVNEIRACDGEINLNFYGYL
jgi:hypothetical protein